MVPVERVSDTESTDSNQTENTRPSLGASEVVHNTDDHLPTQSSPTTTIAAGIDQVISLPVQPLAAAEAVTLTPAQAETTPSIISPTHAALAATQALALCPTQEDQAASRDQPHARTACSRHQ